MILSSLRTELKRRISADDSSSFWDDTTLDSCINSAQIKLGSFRSWEFLLQGRTVTNGSVADQPNYLLPDNYLYGSAIWLEVGGSANDYSYVSFPKFRNDDYDFDKAFTIRGKEVILDPTPTANGTEIHFWYIALPTSLTTDASVSDFPNNFQEALLLYAQAIASQRAGKMSDVANFEKLAEQEAKSIWKQIKKLVRGNKRGGDIMDSYSGVYLR